LGASERGRRELAGKVKDLKGKEILRRNVYWLEGKASIRKNLLSQIIQTSS